MAQLPKGGLVRGHDKPIHGSCAIYFPGGITGLSKIIPRNIPGGAPSGTSGPGKEMENLIRSKKKPKDLQMATVQLDDGNPKSLGNGWKSPFPSIHLKLVLWGFRISKSEKKVMAKKKGFSLGSPIKKRTFNDVYSSRVCHDVSRIFS